MASNQVTTKLLFTADASKAKSTLKDLQKDFDVYVIKGNREQYLIEYDGRQHFEGWSSSEENLKIQKERDNYKNQWCKENNIPLIRIPYTHLDNLCIEDLLLETTQFRVV